MGLTSKDNKVPFLATNSPLITCEKQRDLTAILILTLMSTTFWPLNLVKARLNVGFPLIVKDETRSKVVVAKKKVYGGKSL